MEIIEIENPITKEITEFVIIDRGNGEFTSMPKSVWDELEAAKNEKL
jgi:acyl-CoA thioesterase FadM